MTKELNYGLSLNNKCKKNDFRNLSIKDYNTFEITNKEEIISKFSRYDKINIYILIFKDVPKHQYENLKDFLQSEAFLPLITEGKVEFNLLSDEINFSDCLEFYCSCKMIDNIKIHFDESSIRNIKPRGENELGLIPLYYDLDSIYEDIDETKKGFVPKDLVTSVEKEGYVPEKYWYWHEGTCIHWQNVVESEDYLLSKITRDLLKNNIPKIVNYICKNLRSSSTDHINLPNSIDFIDLGVGTPEKDEIVIKEFLNNSNRDIKSINYYPVDISFPLMEYTLHKILHIKKNYEAKKGSGNKQKIGFNIIPILGDFQKLNYPSYRDVLKNKSPKLIAILGNTFGNFEEKDFLQRIIPILDNGHGEGYLLVDVEFADKYDITDKNSLESLKDQYYNKDMFNFAFHPLSLLNQYPKGNPSGEDYTNYLDVDAKFIQTDDSSIEWHFGRKCFKNITNIPQSIVIFLKYKDIQRKHQFSNYDPKTQEILMIWSTKYKKLEFEKYFNSQKFEKIECWQDKSEQYGLYLFKYIGK